MRTFAIERLLVCIPVLLIISIVVFAAMRMLPGDPVDALYPADASVSPEAKAELRRELGLDQPLPVQYLRWLQKTAGGDLGTSIRSRQPVTSMLWLRWKATAQLVLWSTLLALAIALPAGTIAAFRRGSVIDTGVSMLALTGLSIPNFALGTLLALCFGVWLHWTPTAGSLVLPVMTLGIGTAGILVRSVRSSMLDQLGGDYVRTARGKGLGPAAVQIVHILPNAAPTMVTILATVIGYQLGGAFIIEQIFAWPGLGQLLFQSISGRDYATVQGIALLSTVTYLIVNLVADLGRAMLDPRLRSRS